MPSIDLYAPSGESVFYNAGDGDLNAHYLKSLVTDLHKPGIPRMDTPRPSLKEAIEMFPELARDRDTLLNSHAYVVFALTYANWKPAESQNTALLQLKMHCKTLGIYVVEITLRS